MNRWSWTQPAARPWYVEDAIDAGWTDVRWDPSCGSFSSWIGVPPGGNGGIMAGIFPDPSVIDFVTAFVARGMKPGKALRRARELARLMEEP